MKNLKFILASVAIVAAGSAIYANSLTVVYYVSNGLTNCGTIVTATGCQSNKTQCTIPINTVETPLFYRVDEGDCTVARKSTI